MCSSDLLAFNSLAQFRQEAISAVQSATVLAALPTLNRAILYEEYVKFHQVMPSLLSYWLNEHTPQGKDSTKSSNLEIKMLQQIKEDLHANPAQTSRNLVIYLADDELIKDVVSSRVEPHTVLAQTLDPERYLTREWTDFLFFIQRAVTNETPYKNGLRVLIRRYMAINQLDNQAKGIKDVFGKNGLQAFLEKERVKVQFSFTL